MVYILVTKIGPSSLERTGPMRILRFAPLLAVAGAVCVVAWTPHGHNPPDVATLDRTAVSRVVGAPTTTASMTSGPTSLSATPPPDSGSAPSTSSEAAGRDLTSTDRVPAPLGEVARSDKEAKVQFAYASLEGAAPALGALSAVTPPAETASLEPSAPPPATPEPSAAPADAALPPPPRSSSGRGSVQQGRRRGPHGACIGVH